MKGTRWKADGHHGVRLAANPTNKGPLAKILYITFQFGEIVIWARTLHHNGNH
jgi:hypothetical protein